MSPRKAAKCRECQAPVEFFRSPFTGNVRTFDPTPVTESHPLAGVRAFPVLGGTAAYRPADLVELLMVQRHATETEVADEIRDMPWHLLHDCPPSSTPKD